MKRTISFKDKANNKFEVELTIEDGRFSMSGNYGGGSGQCIDSIEPRTPAQKKLVKMWEQWHLNDMNAGTNLQRHVTDGKTKTYEDTLAMLVTHKPDGTPMNEEESKFMSDLWKEFQSGELPADALAMAALSGMSPKERDEFFYFNMVARYGGNELIVAADNYGKNPKDRAEKWLFNKTLLYDNGYRYGSAWLTESLPESIEDTMDELMDTIEEEENALKERPVSEMSDEEIFEYIEENAGDITWGVSTNAADDDECKVAVALAKMLDLAINELDDIEHERDNEWKVQGTYYLAGTDDDMDDEWDKSLESYLDECVLPDLPENARDYFDHERWKDDAKVDGRGHSLNRYDGGELEADVNGETYYAYQQ